MTFNISLYIRKYIIA